MRVKVPFGNRELIGIIVNIQQTHEENKTSKLKTIIEAIDQQPIFEADLLSLTQWLSDYYHHPIGDCFQTVLPKKIRLGGSAELETETYWQLSGDKNEFKLGKKQQQLFTLLKDHPEGISQKVIYQHIGQCRTSLLGLE
ncbi:MAG TPA: primosomal protein N', partial [Methylophaga sp.]|nr:primosomal protein N' [Methylophaga sp.]